MSFYKMGEVFPVLEILDQFRGDMKYCDAFITIKDACFPAHRNVLAAWSSYLDAQLQNYLLHSNEICKLSVEDFEDVNVFSDFMDYLYSGKITINVNNYKELLQLATTLCIENLSDKCSNFIQCQVKQSKEFFIPALCLVSRYKVHGLLKYLVSELSDETLCVEKQKSFLSLDVNALTEVISALDEHTSGGNTESILRLIFAWVQYDPLNRDCSLKSLLSKVDLARYSQEFGLDTENLKDMFKLSDWHLSVLLQTLVTKGVKIDSLIPHFLELEKHRPVLDSSTENAEVKDSCPGGTAPVVSVKNVLVHQREEVSQNDKDSIVLLVSETKEKGSELRDINKGTEEHNELEDVTEQPPGSESDSESCDIGGNDFTDMECRLEDSAPAAGNKIQTRGLTKASPVKAEKTVHQTRSAVLAAKRKQNIGSDQSGGPSRKSPRIESRSISARASPERRQIVTSPRNKSNAKSPDSKIDTIRKLVESKITEVFEMESAGTKGKSGAKLVGPEYRTVVTTSPTKGKGGTETLESQRVASTKTFDATSNVSDCVAIEPDTKSKMFVELQFDQRTSKFKIKADARTLAAATKVERKLINTGGSSSATQDPSEDELQILYECEHCDYKTYSNPDFYFHLKTHYDGPPYKCKICDYSNRKFRRVVNHRYKHFDTKNFTCPTCGQHFKYPTGLIGHMKVHAKDRPKKFSCTVCGKMFFTLGNLAAHKATHEKSKLFLCDLCGFSSRFQSHLSTHKRIHTGRIFKCEYSGCTYNTPRIDLFKRHQASHEGLKEHQCHTCGKTFSEKRTLKQHEHLHTGYRPFKCSFCDYATYRKDKLKEHTKKKHASQVPVVKKEEEVMAVRILTEETIETETVNFVPSEQIDTSEYGHPTTLIIQRSDDDDSQVEGVSYHHVTMIY